MSKNNNESHLHYLPYIDGLRAVAVLAVVLFHAFPHKLKGGFVGVDIFFVISGFLISKIIIKDIELNTFSVVNFYKKRINRIFPALILVLIATIVVGESILFRHELISFYKNVFFSTTFLSNIYLIFTTNYFGVSAEKNPLLHFWSLGVEEQFYIFWPLLLGYVIHKSYSHSLAILLTITLISFFLNIYYVNINAAHTFFFPLTRFWELGVGSVFALASHHYQTNKSQNFSLSAINFLNVIGWMFLGYSIIYFTPSISFPGWYALIPVFGSILIIGTGEKAFFNRVILSNKLSVFIGVISYPLYLLHWPLLSFFHVYMGQLPKLLKLLLIVCSLILAFLTYLLIEKPIRYKIKNVYKPWILLGLVALISIFSVYKINALTHAKPNPVDRFIDSYANYTSKNNFIKLNHIECSFLNGNGDFTETISKDCWDIPKQESDPMIWIWGDSFAQHLYGSLRNYISPHIPLAQTASYGCAPSFGNIGGKLTPSCAKANSKSIELIKKVKPKIVLLAQRDRYQAEILQFTAKELIDSGVEHVIIVGPAPQWNQYLYRIIAPYVNAGKSFPRYLGGGSDMAENGLLDTTLKKSFANVPTITYVSLYDLLCNEDLKCLTFIDTNNGPQLTTFDYGHFTCSAADHVINHKVGPIIASLLKKPY